MSFITKHRRGLAGAMVFHIALFLILYFMGFTTPLPLPEEEGILVNFGNQSTGSGLEEPALRQSQQPNNIQPEQSRPETSPPVASESEPVESEEEYVTQDFEEAPEMESSQNPERNEAERQEELERQKELERQREIERQKELERQRRLEAERRKREQEQKMQQEAENLAQDAFSAGKNPRDNASSSEGEVGGEGNQGEITGSIETKNREGANNTQGISYSIAGRIPQSLPKPDYTYQIEGKVVVEVTVDRNGYVTNAVPGVKGSTTLDDNLLREAKKAALKARFDRKPDAPAYQKGTITYFFKLN